MHAEIYNGTVVRIWSSLPSAWGNVSGFNLLTADQLADLAWCGASGSSFVPVVEAASPSVCRCCNLVEGPTYTFDAATLTAQQVWTVTPKSDADAWSCLRGQRNNKLRMTDWTQLADSPLTAAQRAEYAQYRQALRDITLQPDPHNLIWPTEPTL